MPKKRVGVSLRKPPPAPELAPESVAAPVAAESVTNLGAADVAASSPDLAERPSDIVALREAPSAPPDAKSIEAFVNGAAAAFERAATELPTARLAEVLQRGPEGYRELIVYLPQELARELSLHCLEHDLDMSRLVATAVEQHLKGAAAPAPSRRAEDTAANDGLLSLAARAVLGELADWVRSLWGARWRPSAGQSAPAAAR